MANLTFSLTGIIPTAITIALQPVLKVLVEETCSRKREWPERPLAWWQGVRREAGLNASSLSLRLGSLYQFLFPENQSLYESWHNAGSDVQMTFHIIEAYFEKARAKVPRGTTDFHLSRPKIRRRESFSTII
jgi:hypothetical protein